MRAGKKFHTGCSSSILRRQKWKWVRGDKKKEAARVNWVPEWRLEDRESGLAGGFERRKDRKTGSTAGGCGWLGGEMWVRRVCGENIDTQE